MRSGFCVSGLLPLAGALFSSSAAGRNLHLTLTLHDFVLALLQLDFVLHQRRLRILGLQTNFVTEACDGVIRDLAVEAKVSSTNFEVVRR